MLLIFYTSLYVSPFFGFHISLFSSRKGKIVNASMFVLWILSRFLFVYIALSGAPIGARTSAPATHCYLIIEMNVDHATMNTPKTVWMTGDETMMKADRADRKQFVS